MRFVNGRFAILTPEFDLKQQIINIERAGRTCYKSCYELNYESASAFIKKLLNKQHESVLEHSNLTVKFLDCSRGFTHELVRHRHCAFSQESTRYVDYSRDQQDLNRFEMKHIWAPERDLNEPIEMVDPAGKTTGEVITPREYCFFVEQYYRSLRKAGYKPEEARQALIIGTASEIVISTNLREWRWIFKLRTEKKAHWEIRTVMQNLLNHLREILPCVFDDL